MNLFILFFAIFFMPSIGIAADEEGKSISIEEFLQSLSTVPGVTERRDPFQAAKPPFEITRTDGDISASAPPLERYQVERYVVLAVMTREQRSPRALIKLPESEKGRVVMVKLFDKLGNRHGQIIKMSNNGITVLQNQRSALGFVDKTEILLPIGGLKQAEGDGK